MKRVILLGADFFPSTLPPALRLRGFAQHLPAFGWHPIVVTTDSAYYEGPVDPELEQLLPPGLEIIRTRALPASLTRLVGVGDIAARSLAAHWQALAAVCRRQPVEALVSSVPPSLSMILGRRLHDRFGVPYLVDYQDPWVIEDYWSAPKAQRPPKWPLAYTAARLLEPFALRRASHLTGVSAGTIAHVTRRYRWLADVPTTEIPFGGEPGDLETVRTHPRPNARFTPGDGHRHVSYVGACIPAMHATIRALFKAVRQGLATSPDLFGRLRLHFVGSSYAPQASEPQVLPLARAEGVAHLVDESPARCSYLDALQLLLDSHALLVLGSDVPHYTASKLFPALLARKPLLVVCHEASAMVTILRDVGAGRVVTFSAQQPPAARAAELLEGLTALLADSPAVPTARAETLEAYTVRAMTARLARVLDTLPRRAGASR